MLPFWIYTQQATGKTCYLPQRMPILNAIVGNSLITDGLTCLPSAPAPHSVLKTDNLPFVELTLFMEDPLAHADLDIRKLPRIFAEPWNDFRRSAVLPNAVSIRLAHQIFWAFAWAALVVATPQPSKPCNHLLPNSLRTIKALSIQKTNISTEGQKLYVFSFWLSSGMSSTRHLKEFQGMVSRPCRFSNSHILVHSELCQSGLTKIVDSQSLRNSLFYWRCYPISLDCKISFNG